MFYLCFKQTNLFHITARSLCLCHFQLLLVTADDEDETGVRQTDLVNWYLKEMEHEIESEAELVEKKNLVEKVIHKLVHMVGCVRYTESKHVEVVCETVAIGNGTTILSHVMGENGSRRHVLLLSPILESVPCVHVHMSHLYM